MSRADTTSTHATRKLTTGNRLSRAARSAGASAYRLTELLRVWVASSPIAPITRLKPPSMIAIVPACSESCTAGYGINSTKPARKATKVQMPQRLVHRLGDRRTGR